MSDSSTAASAPPRLRLAGISKRYASVVANDGIDLAVLPGEIHAVLGENGAGKSTLMKIIYGVVKPDAGSMYWDGREVRIANPARARKLGIGMVFQQFSLFETLTVAENIALALPANEAGRDLPSRIRDTAAKYGLPLDPDRHVQSLSAGERQRLEIVRCLLSMPRLMIMDEPTSVLTPQTADTLFATLRRISREGCSILYISHKLDEIRALCDRATILRAGKVTGECDPRDTPAHELSRLMIGGALPYPRHRSVPSSSGYSLVVRDLSLPASDSYGVALERVSLSVAGGEIVGIAGMSGNGQQALVAALSGERRQPPAGCIIINGTPAATLDAGRRRELGLCFIPEERLGHAAIAEMSLAKNALLTAHRRGLTRHGLIVDDAVRDFARAIIARYDVKTAGPDAPAASLSGGNLQKYIVGREIEQQPTMLIAAQPTAGLDIGAAASIRQALIDMRDAGKAVLVVSDDLDELFEICDRIAVMSLGRLSPPMPIADTDPQSVGLMMSGAFTDDERSPRQPSTVEAIDAH